MCVRMVPLNASSWMPPNAKSYIMSPTWYGVGMSLVPIDITP